MRYFYDELNQRAQLRARLDYFEKHGTIKNMTEVLFRLTFDVFGAVNE